MFMSPGWMTPFLFYIHNWTSQKKRIRIQQKSLQRYVYLILYVSPSCCETFQQLSEQWETTQTDGEPQTTVIRQEITWTNLESTSGCQSSIPFYLCLLSAFPVDKNTLVNVITWFCLVGITQPSNV